MHQKIMVNGVREFHIVQYPTLLFHSVPDSVYFNVGPAFFETPCIELELRYSPDCKTISTRYMVHGM